MRGWLIFGAIIFAIAGCIHEESAKNQGLPLVNAAAPACPKLANPCDRVNCNRPNTRIIA